MANKLVSIYNSYGKNSGEELVERYIIEEDTPEVRKEIAEEWSWDVNDTADSLEKFYNGSHDAIEFYLYGGDWDDPTGRYITIESKDNALAEAELNYIRAVEAIEHMFNIGE